jgi:hypothetical protein
MKVAPESTTLARSQQRYFSARPLTGAVPAGARYVWAVLGRGTLALAAGDSVRYTAPAADGVDTLTVQIVDASGQPTGAGGTPIRIAGGAALAVAIGAVVPALAADPRLPLRTDVRDVSLSKRTFLDLYVTAREAAAALHRSAMLRDSFGDDVVDHYHRAAEWEISEQDRVVMDWELMRGFERA